MVFQQEREMKIMKNVAAQPLPVARMMTAKFKERRLEVDELASDWWWLCWHSFFNFYYSYMPAQPPPVAGEFINLKAALFQTIIFPDVSQFKCSVQLFLQ